MFAGPTGGGRRSDEKRRFSRGSAGPFGLAGGRPCACCRTWCASLPSAARRAPHRRRGRGARSAARVRAGGGYAGGLLQGLVRVPSVSGEEGAVQEVVRDAFLRSGLAVEHCEATAAPLAPSTAPVGAATRLAGRAHIPG